MSVELNHTIIHARNNRESAEFLAHILGLEIGAEWGPFVAVATANGHVRGWGMGRILGRSLRPNLRHGRLGQGLVCHERPSTHQWGRQGELSPAVR